MMAIETQGVSKRYGDHWAVQPLSLSVEAGTLFALLGTNGAGKTTTVKLLTTLLAPTEGSARVLGMDTVKERRKIRPLINVSPQETAIGGQLTVLENLEFMAGVYGLADGKRRIDQLVEQFGLGPVLRQRGKTLSGGWQRKLSIAAALINDPKVLFLDEPTLGLDVPARRDLWHMIEGLKGYTTVVLTTHYMEEAERLAHRVGVMHRGQLVACDTPAALKEQTGTTCFEDTFLSLISGGEAL